MMNLLYQMPGIAIGRMEELVTQYWQDPDAFDRLKVSFTEGYLREATLSRIVRSPDLLI